jgi:peptide/nickel transport system substrate-binding protein
MRQYRVVVLVAAFVVLGSMLGPGGAGSASAASSKADFCTKNRVGGTLNFGQFSMPPSVDPGFRSVGGSGGTHILTALYDTLMRVDAKTGKAEPYLAASLTHNPGFTQYTMKLRPGIKFGNGNPFNAAAVVAAQTRYLSPGFIFNGYTAYIASIVAVDDLTVQYNLKTPWAEIESQLGQTFGMIADQSVQSRLGTAFGTTVNTGAGVGPYELTTFSPPTNVVLKAKTNYWQGPVCIQEIDNTTVTSAQQSLDSFNTGQYDMTHLRSEVLYNTYTQTKPRVGKYQPFLVVGSRILLINTLSKSAHLDDPRVRQALMYGSDINTINQRAFQGALTAHSAIVPKELGIVSPTKGPAYDAAKATKLLSDVKAATGWDGSIRLTCANVSADFGIAYAAVLNNLGFKVTLDTTLPVTPFVAVTQITHDYDIACGGLQVQGGDYWEPLYRVTFAPINYAQFNNPDWNAAMAQLGAAPGGSPAYDTAMTKVQSLMTELAPFIMVGSFNEAVLMQNKVHGIEFTGPGLSLFGRAYLANK